MMELDDKQALAFEYVMGTLTGEEREAVIALMQSDQEIADAIFYWESAMMPAVESMPELEPKPNTFKNIKAEIENRHNPRSTQQKQESFWEKLLSWKMTTAVAFSMLLVVSGFLVKNVTQQGVPADYVAVLVNAADEPVLTALTSSEGSKLWLKWEDWQTPKGHSLQLWSKSRRDGEIRPLLVFEGNEQQVVNLDEATLRLIKDSSHLIITQEERGGSPIDEPSDQVVAKGVCIRLVKASGNT